MVLAEFPLEVARVYFSFCYNYIFDGIMTIENFGGSQSDKKEIYKLSRKNNNLSNTKT